MNDKYVATSNEIDRRCLVTRHNPVLTKPDLRSPFQVGNGNFGFTADITGVQTFSEEYGQYGLPLGTLSNWGWHNMPNPQEFSLEKFPFTNWDSHSRSVPYLDGHAPEHLKAMTWLRSNPHRLNLGKIGFRLRHADRTPVVIENLSSVRQELDLWSGVLSSCFSIDGIPVKVETCCHGEFDQIAIRVKSQLLALGRMQIVVAFPYGNSAWGGDGADWNQPDAHKTQIIKTNGNKTVLHRQLDSTEYYVWLSCSGNGKINETGQHNFEIGNNDEQLFFTCAFAPLSNLKCLEDFESVRQSSSKMWYNFWQSGGAVELAGSSDPRAEELERRIILSQYLTRLQCAGNLPPQETGYLCNSWMGKFHLEMHWWHAAHFALWGRYELLERSLGFYQEVLPKARAAAKLQGYSGARWPKCMGPEGDQMPCLIEPWLIWQQPHPIFYAELIWREKPNQHTLQSYGEIVEESAAFMASFLHWSPKRKQYILGPPLADAAEIYFDYQNQWNPTFELAYWHWGLSTYQLWRERAGLPRRVKIDHMLNHLPPLAIHEGKYVAGETATETFVTAGRNISHPCLLAPLGMLNGAMVDPETMRRTLHAVLDEWNWEKETWGWDYSLTAMTAARLGDGENAVRALMLNAPTNTWLPNGHNFQNSRLPVYLPGNGGLLYAVAMMAQGIDGNSSQHAPGFPHNEQWVIKHEGLSTAI